MWSPDRRDRVVEGLARQRALTAPMGHNNKGNNNNTRSNLPPILSTDRRLQERSNRRAADPTSNTSLLSTESALHTARYLTLKVRAQRRERLLRVEEESALQARVNDHLATILAQHKQSRKDNMDRWKAHANAPVPPPPPPPAVVRAREAEKQREEEERKARRARARDATKPRLQQQQRGNVLPVSSGSGSFVGQLSSSGNNNSMGALAANSPAAEADAKATAAFAQIAQLYDNVLNPNSAANTAAASEGSVSAMLADFVPGSIADMTEDDEFGPLLVGLSPDQKRKLREIEAKQQRTRARAAAKQAMYERALERRRVAAQRIADDPPADVIVQADLRRYISADLLEALPSEMRNGGDGSAAVGLPPGFDAAAVAGLSGGSSSPSFFLTDVDAQRKQKQQAKQQNQRDDGEEGEGGQQQREEGEESNNKKKKSSSKNKTRSKLQAVKDATAKSRALLGGPLENPDNNKKMSIFAREILMKVSVSQKLRSEVDRVKQQEQDELLRARREAIDDDDDDDVAYSRRELTATGTRTGLAPEEEERAAVEWYRRYHAPLLQGGNTRGVGRYALRKDWKASHKPLENLPRPSRTLFFDAERPKDPLRTSLY